RGERGVPEMAEAKGAMSEARSAKGAATRDQILDAASRLIYLRGYHCTSLDDVLRESGVGKGNFYYYFRSKEELGFAIIDRLVHGFAERTLDPAFADAHADPVAQIHDFLDRLLENQRQRKCVGGCPMGNLASELSDVHEGFRQRLAGIFLRWRARLTDALEGGILLTKVTKDIVVMEQCVQHLKDHLTLYTTSRFSDGPHAAELVQGR